MRSIGKAMAGATVAVALVMGGATGAQANNSPTVDYAEFDAAKLGSSVTYVQGLFDTAGRTLEKTSTSLVKTYAPATRNDPSEVVDVHYANRNGVWRVTAREAVWEVTPNPAHNPGTKAEYLAIKAGMTLAQVRSLIGSVGTRAYDLANGYGTVREYIWPASTTADGYVYVQFRLRDGAYVVTRKTAKWD